MKKFVLALMFVPLLFSCQQLQTEILEDDVKDLMEETIIKEGLSGSFEVIDVELVHIDGNQYTGEVEVCIDGITSTHEINVVCDGDTFVYEIPDFLY